MSNIEVINKLVCERDLTNEEFKTILNDLSLEEDNKLFEEARKIAQANFQNKIFIRGLIEISNVCANDCFYCGIRKSNTNIERYTLDSKDILECCHKGYELGFRTFVLQGGERNIDESNMIELIKGIRSEFKDCAITLSLGEKDEKTYQAYFDAGANRYLLRHETINEEHYRKLHPKAMSLQHRIECLQVLKKIGFQCGSGIMVGSPFQSVDNMIEDIRFIQELKPQMIGLGPYMAHHDTPFKDYTNGSLKVTLRLLAIFRIMFPNVLLPATTSLASLSDDGRKLGILAGANVVMPNLSPTKNRKQYALYDHKKSMGNEAAEGLNLLSKELNSIGYEISYERGDYKERGTNNV